MSVITSLESRSGQRRPQSVTANANQRAPNVVVEMAIGDLKPYDRNARRHGDRQIELIARSVTEFGFVNPVLIDKDRVIVAGHGRYEAAKRLGLDTVPTLRLEHLSPAQLRAYRIADNRIAELSDWNEDVLRLEIVGLAELSLDGALSFDLDLTGFDTPAIDLIIAGANDPDNAVPETVTGPDRSKPAVTRPGDLWVLGRHRLFCGDSLAEPSFDVLLAGATAQMVFTDPPFNVRILGNVRSGTASGHREFAMASGEMSDREFGSSSRPA